MALDVLGFALMSNHLHVVVRNRPDVAERWTDDEVARRWWSLCPLRREPDGQPAEPSEHELDMTRANPARLAEVRRRLSSIPWLMRFVAEPIARRANREDGCTGRFWEGRYRCQRLLDDAALVSGLVYVDLNPIRAGIAQTPEESRFTSLYERIQARLETTMSSSEGGQSTATDGAPEAPKSAQPEAHPNALPRDAWLSPLELAAEVEVPGGELPSVPVRASNTGCLPLSWADYSQLVDWTGRQWRADKRGSIPAELAPIFERLHLGEAGWWRLLAGFQGRFQRAAGCPAALEREARARGVRWIRGIGTSRAAFAAPKSARRSR
jgi:REP element-mobilizing transposase RayT